MVTLHLRMLRQQMTSPAVDANGLMSALLGRNKGRRLKMSHFSEKQSIQLRR
jgi:hypothetical protein